LVAARAIASANRTKAQSFHEYFATTGQRKTVLTVPKGEVIFRQGDAAGSIFFIQRGRVKISVTSSHGKDATLALLGKGEFIGQECIAESHPFRLATATAILPSTVFRIDSKEMTQELDADKSLARLFQSFLLTRCVLMQSALIDHLFNSSEKRLARSILLMAQVEGGIETTIPHTPQETLAEMIGTTRSRVSFFMNRFRTMGYIQYRGCGGVKVHRSLYNVLLKD
jgi:CRP/FNR family transcriptional regulator, cyclic AMP receptor protein